MSISIDLYEYNYGELFEALCREGADDDDLLCAILDECGLVRGGKYILLNNEYGDEWSPYFNLCTLLDSAFPELTNTEREGRDTTWYGVHAIILKMKTDTMRSRVDVQESAARLGIVLVER